MPSSSPNDIEIQSLLELIGRTKKFQTNFGQIWGLRSKAEILNLRKKSLLSPDPIKFLQTALKTYDPKIKLWKPGAKITPGNQYGLVTPNISLTPSATKFLSTPEKVAQSKALMDKIATHNAEIKKLQKAQAAYFRAEKAKKEHEKLKMTFDEQLLKYFVYIEKNCSEYLKSVRATGKILFRGQAGTELPIFIGHPRINRPTKDSDFDAQIEFDKNLLLTGFKALRSNSIFATSDQQQAIGYGNLYVIFPKNGFQFTWSTVEEDLILNNMSDVYNIDDDITDLYYKYDDLIGEVEQELNDFFYYEAGKEDKNLKKLPIVKELSKISRKWGRIHPDSENSKTLYKDIYITFLKFVKTYLKICKKIPKFQKKTSPIHKRINKLILFAQKSLKTTNKTNKEKATKMIKHYGLQNKDMISALKSGHEVYILGEYIAVKWDKYDKQIKAYFLKK